MFYFSWNVFLHLRYELTTSPHCEKRWCVVWVTSAAWIRLW